MERRGSTSRATAGTGDFSLEGKLRQTADALHDTTDAAEHSQVVLGLIPTTNISDGFEARHAELINLVTNTARAAWLR